MPYSEALWLYFVLLVGIIVVPGMDMLFVVANALTGGRGAGLAATAGIMLGGICHTLFGTVFVTGLAVLVPSLAPAMMVIGAAYMLWIGFTLARSSIKIDAVGPAAQKSDMSILLQGMLTAILNPKAWMFVMAVFPQFMRPEYGPFATQALVMGIMTVTVQLAVYGSLGLAANRGREALTDSPGTTIWLGRAAGLLLMAIAAYALLTALREF